MVICRIAKIELIDTTCATLYRTIKRIVFDGLFALLISNNQGLVIKTIFHPVFTRIGLFSIHQSTKVIIKTLILTASRKGKLFKLTLYV